MSEHRPRQLGRTGDERVTWRALRALGLGRDPGVACEVAHLSAQLAINRAKTEIARSRARWCRLASAARKDQPWEANIVTDASRIHHARGSARAGNSLSAFLVWLARSLAAGRASDPA